MKCRRADLVSPLLDVVATAFVLSAVSQHMRSWSTIYVDEGDGGPCMSGRKQRCFILVARMGCSCHTVLSGIWFPGTAAACGCVAKGPDAMRHEWRLGVGYAEIQKHAVPTGILRNRILPKSRRPGMVCPLRGIAGTPLGLSALFYCLHAWCSSCVAPLPASGTPGVVTLSRLLFGYQILLHPAYLPLRARLPPTSGGGPAHSALSSRHTPV